jgi:hypothetical protein
VPRAWQARPGRPGRWRPAPQGPALRPEVRARLPQSGSLVLRAAVALLAVPGRRRAAGPLAERSAGVAPQWSRLADSAHSALPPGGSLRHGPALLEARRLAAVLRGAAERRAAVGARRWAQAPPAGVLLQPPGERQTLRYRPRSVPVRRIPVPWRGRRDRRWRNSGK